MQDVLSKEIIEGEKCALNAGRTLVQVGFQLGEESDVLRQSAGSKEAEHFREPQLRLVLHDAGFCAGRALLLKAVVCEHISTKPEAQVLRHVVEADVAEILLPDTSAIFRARQLVSVFKKPFSECVESWRRRVAGGAGHRIFSREGGYGLGFGGRK